MAENDLTITTWWWGTKYSFADVQKLYHGFQRHLSQPFRFVVVTDQKIPKLDNAIERLPIADIGLTMIKGCFARLRMFDPAWQKASGLRGRIVLTDLDTVLTGPLDPIFDRDEPFLILHGANSLNPCKFCGALMMLREGEHPEIW